MVEYQLPKLATGVRFPSLAPNLLCKFDPEAPLNNATNRSIVGAEGPKTILIAIIFALFLSGCKTASAPYVADTRSISGVYHYVRGGETLWSISKLYDVDMNTILEANRMHDTASISRGQRLLIPGISRRPPEEKKEFLFRDSFRWPLNGQVVSPFGSKIDRTRNKGIDIKAAPGASVKASRAGRVVFCDDYFKGFGKTIILDHGDNFQTVYAYNSIILVKAGDLVEQNSIIARAGVSGRAKEPSLHFEIRRNGEPQNPFYYLPR